MLFWVATQTLGRHCGRSPMKWLDSYAAYARLTPALLVIAPAFNVLLALGKSQSPIVLSVLGLAVAVGFPIVVEAVVRDEGVKMQDVLWSKWGGSPTSQLLREPALDDPDFVIRNRWRERLADIAKIDLKLADDPLDQGQHYRLMTSSAIEATRGHARLLEENKRYGYQRNLFAIRPWGVGVAVSSGVGAAATVFVIDDSASLLKTAVVLVAIAGIGFWLGVPAEKRVQAAGNRYARALFDASLAQV